MKQPASPARQAPCEGGAHRAADTALADDPPSSASPARTPDDAAPVAGQGRAVEAPRAAEDLGLGDRYRYLAGASGTRYLFSLVPTDALEDFRNAVVLIELGPRRRRGKPDGPGTGGPAAGGSGTGGPDQPRTVWIGELDRYGTRRGPPLSAAELRGREALVHLLAGRSAERRQVLEDLVAAFEDGSTRVLFG